MDVHGDSASTPTLGSIDSVPKGDPRYKKCGLGRAAGADNAYCSLVSPAKLRALKVQAKY